MATLKKDATHEQRNSISLAFEERVEENADIGAIYEDKVSSVNNIAKKNGFKNYRITSQDMSSSHSSSGNTYDVYISICLETSFDYGVITTLFRESGASNISASQYGVEVFDDENGE